MMDLFCGFEDGCDNFQACMKFNFDAFNKDNFLEKGFLILGTIPKIILTNFTHREKIIPVIMLWTGNKFTFRAPDILEGLVCIFFKIVFVFFFTTFSHFCFFHKNLWLKSD